MLTTIFLDMDGVIVDLYKGCKNVGIIKQNGSLDRESLLSQDSYFWAGLDWTPNGKALYESLVEFCEKHTIALCILTKCCNKDTVVGKKSWLNSNTSIKPINQYFVTGKSLKSVYATETSVLIDDYQKNIDDFVNAGGHALKYDGDNKAILDELEALAEDDNIESL